MEKDIPVSVVVPVYNVEKFLPQCIDSLLAQTHPNLEIVLVNDGSTDGSGAICDQYAVKHSNIKVIHKENGGLSDARNAGITAAQGAYIGFVDSDDFVESTMYEQMLKAALCNDAQVSVCGKFITDEAGNVRNKEFTLPAPKTYKAEDALKELLSFGELDVSVCDKLFRRDLAEDIRFPVGEINEDAAVIFQLIAKAEGVVHIGLPMYYYRGRSGSITKSGYNPNKIQMLDHAQHISAFVVSRFPEMKADTGRYIANTCCQMLCLMLKDSAARKQYPDHYSRCMKGLRENIWKLYDNHNISLSWKLRGTMVYLNLYEVLYKILK